MECSKGKKDELQSTLIVNKQHINGKYTLLTYLILYCIYLENHLDLCQ